MKLEWDVSTSEDACIATLKRGDGLRVCQTISKAPLYCVGFVWPDAPYCIGTPARESRVEVIDHLLCQLAQQIESLQAIKKELEAEYQRCLK